MGQVILEDSLNCWKALSILRTDRFNAAGPSHDLAFQIDERIDPKNTSEGRHASLGLCTVVVSLGAIAQRP